MFLRTLLERNPGFVQAATELHQAGRIPANSYVLDLDAIEANTAGLCRRARELHLVVYAMTKQIGRAGAALDAMAAGGADGFVAVDMACARPIVRRGHRLGHLGHLVQVPRGEAGEAAGLAPDYWTVFSRNKAEEAAAAARSQGRSQSLLVRVFDDGDEFYPGHEGGVPLSDLPAMIDHLASLEGATFAGLTTFPALLYDESSERARITPNMETLARAAGVARRHRACPEQLQLNAPGTTSTDVLALLAEAGATQVEPGHGLSGTTPLHALGELPELPAVLYLSEIAHLHHGVPLCFGGGLYVDPVFGDYQIRAVVAADPSEVETQPVPVDMPSPAAIDYYARLFPDGGRTIREGATVIFGFRVQAFVTRAWVVGVAGVYAPDAGVMRVDGVERSISTPDAARALGIETVHQTLAVIDTLDVAENLFLNREHTRGGSIGAWFGVLDKKRMRIETGHILERLGIRIPSLRRPMGALSGGQRQAVAIGRATAWGRQIVMLDEPAAALGVEQAARVLELIGNLREGGAAVLLITHNMDRVSTVCDRAVVLRQGRKTAEVAVSDVTKDDLVAYITGAKTQQSLP